MKRTRILYWILNGKVPEPCQDLMRWARWYETADRRVAQDSLAGGEVLVSTIFLGLDHRFGGGRPILFETMVFGEEHVAVLFGREVVVHEELDGCRYATWDEAEAGHKRLVQLMRERIATAQEETARAMKREVRQ